MTEKLFSDIFYLLGIAIEETSVFKENVNIELS